MAISGINFLTRPLRYSNGGDVFTPNVATEDLGILENDPVMLDQAIKEFDPVKYFQNLTKDADYKAASDMATDRAVGEVSNAVSDYLKKKGYKITFDAKGFANWLMGKNPDGSSKFTKTKDGNFKLPKDYAKKNREQLNVIFGKTPAGFVRNYLFRTLSGVTREVAPNLVESITDYFTEDTGPKSKDFGAVDVKGEGVLDISKIKGVIPADEYYKDLGGFDDIVTRNVIVNQNRRYADIFTGRTKEDRLDRQALRYQASQNEDIQRLLTLLNNKEKKAPFTPEMVSLFTDIYKQRNPANIEYLRAYARGQFNSLRELGMKLEDYEGGITQEDVDFYTETKESKRKYYDMIFLKAENVLKNYKASNPKATGVELKVNKLGDTNITDLLKTDSTLNMHLSKAQSEVPLSTIINTLKDDGLFSELGFDNYFLASQIKEINSPTIDKYLAEKQLDKLPKDFDYSSLLSPDQKTLVTQVNAKVTEVMENMNIPAISSSQRGQGFPDVRKKVKDKLRQNLNRMILYQLREGKDYPEIMESFKEQTDDPAFYREVVPLILESVQIRNYIDGLNKDLGLKELGLDIDNVVLAHSRGVLKDVSLTFKINNLYIGDEKLNQEESTIQRGITKQGEILAKYEDRDDASLTDKEKKEIVKANEKLTDYKAQLENKGYYDSVESPSPASVSAEQEQQIKRAISEAMFNEPTYFKKDGGIISIFDMIKPVNAQR
jgi:hypothetical protein